MNAKRENESIDLYSGEGDELIYVRAGGTHIIYLSQRSAPAIENDRDRAVLRALLQLALERLDRASLMPMSAPEVSS